MKTTNHILTFDQLKEGYIQTLENAVRFFAAGSDLLKEFPDKALALGQLGQEELGKSLTLLAGFGLPPNGDSWKWFWKGWSDHQLKAHRAFLYEIISPLRLGVQAPDGRRLAGEPLRPKISQEKEAGFYVDFDHASGRFIVPFEQVSLLDASVRVTTLSYLSATADAVRRALLADDVPFRLRAFGELALRICSEDLYQQDMPRLSAEMSARGSRYAALISDLETALAANKTFFEGIKPQPSSGP